MPVSRYPKLQSFAAVLAGMLAVVLPSVGTDSALNALGFFPPPGQPSGSGLLLVATLYRTVYGVIGGFVAAALAPYRSMAHALLLGMIGLVMSTLGVVATWGQEAIYGPAWYPIALAVLALPQAWGGGKLFEIRKRDSTS